MNLLIEGIKYTRSACRLLVKISTMKGKCLDEDLGKEGLRKGYLLHLQVNSRNDIQELKITG